MNATTWQWKNYISADACENIINSFYVEEEKMSGEIRDEYLGGMKDASIRKTNICWIPKEENVSIFLFSRALIANQKANWGFDIDDYEITQIAKYQDGDHYNWHKDEDFFNRAKNVHRKISVVVFLSDPQTYEGGDLLLHLGGEQGIDNSQGTIVCFPSEIMHKVTPITQGVRHSLVLWANGPLMR